MSTITVTTKEELKKAKADNVDEIIVIGKLAKDLRAAKKITKLGSITLGVLTTAIATGLAAAPLTGGASIGISSLVATPIAISTGLSVPVIIFISSLGVAFVLAIFKDYQEIEFDAGKPSIKLKKK